MIICSKNTLGLVSKFRQTLIRRLQKTTQEAPLVTTKSGILMELLYRSTVTWTGCVAAMALEDGHVLPTST